LKKTVNDSDRNALPTTHIHLLTLQRLLSLLSWPVAFWLREALELAIGLQAGDENERANDDNSEFDLI
jgi:hypothetical protein